MLIRAAILRSAVTKDPRLLFHAFEWNHRSNRIADNNAVLAHYRSMGQNFEKENPLPCGPVRDSPSKRGVFSLKKRHPRN